MRRLADSKELLDGPLDKRMLNGNLLDMATVNRFLGGSDLSWRALVRLLQLAPVERISLLDVGTGAADIPRALLRRSMALPFSLEITATDVRPQIVAVARTRSRGVKSLTVGLGSGERLGQGDRAFDVVHSSMVMHHLEPDQILATLAEMGRVARIGVIVNDLDRARRWWLLAWYVSLVWTSNAYTRHDAPLSVRRAYRPAELAALAGQVGLREVARLWTRPAYRYALVLVPT